VAELRLTVLDEGNLDLVLWWFDDDYETRLALGDGEWVRRSLRLMATQPGTSDGSQTVVDRVLWVAFEEESPGRLDRCRDLRDGSAGLAVVVSPTHRGRGLCPRIIRTALEHPRVASVRRLLAGVAVDNHASAHCLGNAGFTRLSDQPDEESMLHYELTTEAID
jgi:hypothetical protein